MTAPHHRRIAARRNIGEETLAEIGRSYNDVSGVTICEAGAMTILDERGLFWWHHEPIPERQFAPDSCVPGLLRIDDDGRITLELDGRLSSDKGPMSVLPSFQDAAELEGKLIQGILKGSNKHVLLSDITKLGGHLSSHEIFYEEYAAFNCLVGDYSLPRAVGIAL
jgi:hypothetical protein